MENPFNIEQVSTRDNISAIFYFRDKEDQNRFLREGVVEVQAPGQNGLMVSYFKDSASAWLRREPDYVEYKKIYRVVLCLMDVFKLSDALNHDIAMHLSGKRKDGTLRVVVHDGDHSKSFPVPAEDLLSEIEESNRQKRNKEKIGNTNVIPFPKKK